MSGDNPSEVQFYIYNLLLHFIFNIYGWFRTITIVLSLLALASEQSKVINPVVHICVCVPKSNEPGI